MNISDCGVIVQNISKSELVAELKMKQGTDTILYHFKGAIHQKKVDIFSQNEKEVLHYRDRLCVPMVSELRQQILKEKHIFFVFCSFKCH